MTGRGRRWIASALVVIAIVAAAIAALIVKMPAHVVGPPPVQVPLTWNAVRSSPGHQAHVDAKGIACRECHGVEDAGFTNPGAAPCARCHANEVTHAHAGEATKTTDCLGCHTFTSQKEKPTCTTCHAQPQGKHAAIATHATTACTQCHRPHGDPALAPKVCTECHDVKQHPHVDHVGSKGCFDCHTAHALARAAKTTCNGCHEAAVGTKLPGHDTCLECHKPHDFKANAATCIGCHSLKATLAAPAAVPHTDCTSCHAPHVRAPAADACKRCHADVPAQDVHGGCTGCHAPHGGGPIAKTCTECHGAVASNDTGTHARGSPCTTCHAPHAPRPPPRLALCRSCHAREVTLASFNVGHVDCASCHGTKTHTPSPAPACATCHAKERATAPEAHRDCVKCHEPHGGSRTPAAACASCHAKEAGTPHGSIQGGCETCHRPHGPGGVASPPPCRSCHAPQTLPALHVAQGHADCAKCHTSHAPPRSDRATCTGACHVGRRDHQPQAAVCSGCHTFRR